MRRQALIGATAAAGAGVFGYAAVIERNWFALRRYDVPVLAPGARPLRLLHISDAHLTPGRHRLMSWIRSLDALQPDLVVNTGDSIAHRDSVLPFLEALGPLLDRPGVFVYGSNDLYSPMPKNPARYLWRDSTLRPAARREPDLPWAELGASMEAAGWLDANNRRGRIKAGDLDIEVAGVHDSHIHRDRYDEIARPGRPSGRPAPRRDALARAHGPGQVRRRRLRPAAGRPHPRRPGLPAVVRRAGDQLRYRPARAQRAAPASRGRLDDPKRPWLHVSAGLGTSPWAPFRLCCRPEASLLTLVPRDS